jgi:putative DNA primase/helicase
MRASDNGTANLDARAEEALAKLSRAVGRDLGKTPGSPPLRASSPDQSKVILRRGSDVTPAPIDWIWPGWLAAGKLHLIGGAPGTGKTTVAVSLAATLSAGGRWPDGSRATAGDVVVWSGEDDNADTLNPRLRAAGADLDRIFTIDRVIEKGTPHPFDPAHDLDALRASLESLDRVRLLIVDPIVSAVAGDSHRNAETRRSLQPLIDLANDLGCAILGVTHFSKGSSGREPLERITGSLAFGALARMVWVTAQQKEDESNPSRRLLLRAKSNIGPEGGGFVYDLRQEPLPDHPGIEASRAIWIEAIQGSARDLLAEVEAQDEDRSATSDAIEWLREALAAGPRSAREVQQEAKGAGIGEKPLRTARERLRIKPQKSGFDSGWVWALPKMSRPAEGAAQDGRASSDEPGIFASDSDGPIEL